MLKYGKETALPDTYRITLALSVAFLAHTLLMATFPYKLPENRHNPVTVQVQLAPEGSEPTANIEASEPDAPLIASPFAINEFQQPVLSPDAPTTINNPDRATPEPEPEQSQAPSPSPTESSQLESQQQASSSSSNQPSAASAAGTPKPRQQAEQPEDITQKSTRPSQETAYQGLLAQTIGKKGGVSKKRYLELGINRSVKEARVLEAGLALKLLPNGTLIEAKVTRPSGSKEYDLMLYKAALEASPYPKPPDSLKGQRWFSVKLKSRDF